MRIWFDISNAPHVLMFQSLIQDLKNHGHEIIITARPLSNTIDLLNSYKLVHQIVGKHNGKHIVRKLIGYPLRVFQLVKYLKHHKPDLAVSQSSFHAPLAAFLLRIPSIYTNDNEHALGNKVAFLFATRILLPDVFPIKKVTRKMIFYPGIKEGLYLWNVVSHIQQSRRNSGKNKMVVYIRPEPRLAQYYNGKLFFLDELILSLVDQFKVVILSRDKEQLFHYRNLSSKLIVPEQPISFYQIVEDCMLFIGAGGTMTRELAYLGIRCISVYQEKLLKVDEVLIKNQLLYHVRQVDFKTIYKIMMNQTPVSFPTLLQQNGKEAYNKFKKTILSYA